jgi:hypothetical protein
MTSEDLWSSPPGFWMIIKQNKMFTLADKSYHVCGWYSHTSIFAGDTCIPSLCLREIQGLILYVCGRYRLSFSMFAGDTVFPSLFLWDIQAFLLYVCGRCRLSFSMFAGDTGFPSLRLREIQAFFLYVCGRYRLSFSMFVGDTGFPSLWLWEIQAFLLYDCERYRHVHPMIVRDTGMSTIWLWEIQAYNPYVCGRCTFFPDNYSVQLDYSVIKWQIYERREVSCHDRTLELSVKDHYIMYIYIWLSYYLSKMLRGRCQRTLLGLLILVDLLTFTV